VASVTLEDLDKQFRTHLLHNKLVNVVDEVSEKTKLDDGVFKRLVSGGMQTVERKYQDAYSIKSSAKWVIAGNKLPMARDTTYGYMRRIIILTFPVTIPDSEQDEGLAEKIIDNELSGLLNWALMGYQRLCANKLLTIPSSSTQAKCDYEKQIAPARIFFDDYIERSSGWALETGEAYDEYRKWCGKNGHEEYSHRRFTVELKRFFDVADDEVKRNGKGTVLHGFRLSAC